MYMLLHKPHLVKWSTKGGKGSKMSKKMSTWFMTQTIAFRDVTVKFFDMGLNRKIRTIISIEHCDIILIQNPKPRMYIV